MISVREALRILDSNIPQPRKEFVPLEQAYGSYLSEDIRAPEDSPRFTSSAMDGFALRWEDCLGVGDQGSARLRVIGESQAGIPFEGKLSENTAVRISTGALLPAGADTVVRVEDTIETGEYVEIHEVRGLGQDVRKSGEEFREGDLLFRRGALLGARELALLAAVGMSTIPIFAAPRVSLLITGTELARPDESDIRGHQIRDSNSIMLKSAVQETGAFLRTSIHVLDNLEQTTDSISEAVQAGDDIILCSGGVSVGRHDHVKDAALASGFVELFWKIRQKPGKPLFVCRRKDTLLFGLPGNPVSAFMCFTNYVRPVLARLRGTTSLNHSVTAATSERLVNKSKRTNFIRVNIEDKPNHVAVIKEMAKQGSHMLSSIVHADGYIILEPETVLEPGSLIEVFLF